jgi:hypothetical protein
MSDETRNTKNYGELGGNKWTVGGTLEIGGKFILLPGAEVTGFPVAENQAASEASTIAALKEDFNALLDKLKAAGLMIADE